MAQPKKALICYGSQFMICAIPMEMVVKNFLAGSIDPGAMFKKPKIVGFALS
jgi:hypothetical protein